MLAIRTPQSVRRTDVRCAASKSTPANVSRRALVSAPLLLGALIAASPVLAYGGTKEIMAFDAGSGNKDYDDLMAAIRQRKEGTAQSNSDALKDRVRKREAKEKAEKAEKDKREAEESK